MKRQRMNISFMKNKKKFTALMLFALSAVFGLVILIKVSTFLMSSARANTLMQKIVTVSKPEPDRTEDYLSQSKKLAEKLKEKNIFVLQKSKPNPGKGVSGICGNEVLISGKWYKLGDKVDEGEITAIEPTRVKIRWKGKEQYFYPIGAASSPGPKRKETKPAPKGTKKEVAAPQEQTAEITENVTREEDPLAWLGVELSDNVRAKLLEKWNSLSDEEKEKFKEQWNNMPDEQKQKSVEAWEQHL